MVGGENLIDFIQTGTEGGFPIYQAMPGGSCYNVALTVARQNQSVTFISPISNDKLGGLIASRLIEERVVLGLSRSDAPTSLAIVSIFGSEANYQFYRNGTADRQIDEPLLDNAFKKLPAIFHIGSLSLIDGVDAEIWERKFQDIANRGVITSLDPNVRSGLIKDKQKYISRLNRMFKYASILKLSDEDLQYLMPRLSIEEAFNQLWEKSSNAKLLILTKGVEGAILRTSKSFFEIEAVPAQNMCDTVGAGDTFMGTILTELCKRTKKIGDISTLSDEEVRLMAKRAALAASLNCQKVGCDPPFEEHLAS